MKVTDNRLDNIELVYRMYFHDNSLCGNWHDLDELDNMDFLHAFNNFPIKVENKVDENASTKRGNIAIVLWYINLEKKKTTFLDRLKFLFKG